MTKAAPIVEVLENLLADKKAVKDQELKSLITSLRKLNVKKLDKRVDYEKKNTKNESLLSSRLKAIENMVEASKELRMLSQCAAKSSSLSTDTLKEKMDALQDAFHVLVPGKFVAVPLAWVQAGYII